MNMTVDRGDIAPSRFARIEREGYFTIDADWIVPALCRVVHVEGPVLEPCAGAGHMVRELRALGLTVHAADRFAYPETIVPDIATGVDIFALRSLADYRFVITNLPYREQNAILAHILPIAARDGCSVAILARSEWRSAQNRSALVHDNLRFAGEVALTKRPVWVRPPIASPRHWFSWFVWSPEPRPAGRDPFLRFAATPLARAARIEKRGTRRTAGAPAKPAKEPSRPLRRAALAASGRKRQMTAAKSGSGGSGTPVPDGQIAALGPKRRFSPARLLCAPARPR
ncbi:MAG TPA: hypothetical protein VIH81_13435 [Roseiarcus sp.]